MMHEAGYVGFDVYFSKLPDPSISRKKLYPLIEILFAVLDPEAFKSCFVSWVKSLQSALQDVIAIDGKTLCNSADLPITCLNAWRSSFILRINKSLFLS
ncbi:MAG: hypothetical protein WC627_10875 [Legionella sp.]|jgi:hypothetical protein